MDDSAFRRVTDRLVEVSQADDRIRALLVYGSHAAGTADAFSDLDIGLVIADGAYDNVITHPEDLVRAIGHPLLLEDFGNPANLHVILADGADLELIIGREGELTLELPYRVLLDKGGVVPRQLQDRRPPSSRPVATDGVRQLVHGFWHDVGHLTTALGRGNTWWAYGQLEELRRACLALARLEAGAEPEDEPYWKIDGAISEERLAALRATVAAPDIAPMRDSALALVELYRQLVRAVAPHHGIAYPIELDRLMSARLRAGEG